MGDLTKWTVGGIMIVLRSDRCGAFAFSATAHNRIYLKGKAPRTRGLTSRYPISATGGNVCGAFWV